MFNPYHMLFVLGISLLFLASCSGYWSAAQPAGTGGLGTQPSSPNVQSGDMQFTTNPSLGSLPETKPPAFAEDNIQRIGEIALIEVDYPYRVKWSSDSKVIGVQTSEGLNLYNADNLQTLSSIITGAGMLLDYSLNSRLMAVTKDQKSIELREVSTAQLIRTIETPGMSLSASFSPDGRYLAIGSGEEIAVGIYDTNNGQIIATLKGFETAAPVYNAFFAEDGTHLIWQARATLQITDITSRQSGAVLSHEEFVSGVSLSPDGKILAAGSAGMINLDYKSIIKLWDPLKGDPLGVIVTGENIPQSIAFSSDGIFMAAGIGGTLVIWNPTTQQELLRRMGHSDSITSLSFSPDGTTLVTAGSDGTVRLWQSSH